SAIVTMQSDSIDSGVTVNRALPFTRSTSLTCMATSAAARPHARSQAIRCYRSGEGRTSERRRAALRPHARARRRRPSFRAPRRYALAPAAARVQLRGDVRGERVLGIGLGEEDVDARVVRERAVLLRRAGGD